LSLDHKLFITNVTGLMNTTCNCHWYKDLGCDLS